MEWLHREGFDAFIGLGLLAVRAVVGAAFVLHGLPKIRNPTGWLSGMGKNVPGPLQAVGAFTEVGGGIALVLGLLTRLAAAGLIAQMLAALFLVHFPARDPFVAHGRSTSELAFVFLAIALLLLATGAGPYSLDALLFG
jgi:putative oxidoreductase